MRWSLRAVIWWAIGIWSVAFSPHNAASCAEISFRQRSSLSQLFWLIFLLSLGRVTDLAFRCSCRGFCSREKVDFMLGYHQFNWITLVCAKSVRVALGITSGWWKLGLRSRKSCPTDWFFFGPFLVGILWLWTLIFATAVILTDMRALQPWLVINHAPVAWVIIHRQI